MKKTAIILLVFSLIFLISNQSNAGNSNSGSYGAAFLKIPVGARATALGGAYTALADDIYAAYYNPAGIDGINKCMIAFQHNDWLLDIKHEYIGVGFKLNKKSSLALSAIIMDLGNEVQTKETALGAYDGTDGTWSASDMSIGLSYSHKLNNALSFGATGKYIKQEIAGYSADAYALDLGLQTTFIEQDIKLGLSVQNIGTKLKFISEEDKLPILIRAGISYGLSDLILSGDLVKAQDNDLILLAGCEYSFAKIFSLRAGWKSNDDLSSSGISAGLGLKYNNFSIDYSFEPKDNFGDVHRFSLDYKF
ncbi:MAG TPA: PorV/PorQ family protein [bacterium]|nr:PorV/PorQ family protein [bacterium]HPN32004.1 PorV/PorQ family protein [bacterium]